MTRIPLSPSVPEELRALFKAATNGRQPALNLHTEMATTPVVLAAYVGIRRALEAHSTLDRQIRFALMLAFSAVDGCEYTRTVNRVLTARAGMPADRAHAVLADEPTGEPRLDALLPVAERRRGMTAASRAPRGVGRSMPASATPSLPRRTPPSPSPCSSITSSTTPKRRSTCRRPHPKRRERT